MNTKFGTDVSNKILLNAANVGRHLYISSPETKWKGFGAIVTKEVRPRGREDIPDPCTERATRCEKYTFNCKYRIDLANLVVIPYLKLCWTRLVDTKCQGCSFYRFWLKGNQ